MKTKVYIIVEQGFINNEFAYDHGRAFFTSKKDANNWIETEKKRLMHEEWTIIDERPELQTFGAKKEKKKLYFVTWSGVTQ